MKKIVYTFSVKSGLSEEMFDNLYGMADLLKAEIEDCSDFTVSWGPKDYKSVELNLYIDKDIHISNSDDSEGKRISDVVIKRLKENIELINVSASFVTSDFALCNDEQEMRDDNGYYTYTLDEIL